MFSIIVLLINVYLATNCNGSFLIDQLKWRFLTVEKDIWQYVIGLSTIGLEKENNEAIAKTVEVFHHFDKDFRKMPQDVFYGTDVMRELPEFLLLYPDLKVINDMYEKFRKALTASATSNNTASLLDVGEIKLSHIAEEILHEKEHNMTKLFENIFHRTFVESEHGNLLAKVYETISDPNYFCKSYSESHQQVIYNLYNLLNMIGLKGYTMMQFSYLVNKFLKKGNKSNEVVSARAGFERISNDISSLLMNEIKTMSGKLWRCDSTHHVKGISYDELTGLLQGHIENEVDMNKESSCTENCEAYSLTKKHSCYDKDSAYCDTRKACRGTIHDCQFIESDMNVCYSNKSASRRYEFIEYKSGQLFGNKKTCQTHSVDSWYRWFVHCSSCFCFCDQEGPSSDRYFNLRPAMSNVDHNRVVTGLRIVKHNRIIHLQIQEGLLLPYGYIDHTTIRWIPVDDYTISGKRAKDGVDYYTMNYNRRLLFMDNIIIDQPNYVVTGVRFIGTLNSLKLQLIVQSFNFETGVISKQRHYLTGGEKRRKIPISDPDVPINSPPSEPNFDKDTYVQFTYSSLAKDAAQSTVPFFDSQPVAANPPLPLQGAGIYYKGLPGYGGFIAPTITTYNIAQHVPTAKAHDAQRTAG